MVTKEEVRNYYADKHDKRDVEPEYKVCPSFVIRFLENREEDETGMYTLIGELFGKREYYTMEEIKQSINREIEQYINDLQKIINY